MKTPHRKARLVATATPPEAAASVAPSATFSAATSVAISAATSAAISTAPTGAPGEVIFIGAGPGAADLITLRGARALARADVVLFDALTDPALRDFAPQAQWLDVGKRGFGAAVGQARINALLVQMAGQHRVVARLKGGDPSLFGRLEEELLALAEAGIQSQVIPGVTAALAAAADLQRPLTRRGCGRSLSLHTAMTDGGQLQAAPGGNSDTAVYYMAGRQLGALARRLREAGWAPGSAVSVVSRAGCADCLASEHRLEDLAAAALLHSGRPTVVCVGVGAQALAQPPVLMQTPLQTPVQGSAQTPMQGHTPTARASVRPALTAST